MEMAHAVQMINEMIAAGGVDEEILGGLELTEALTEISTLVSGELMHLSGLDENDPETNEEIMRQAIQNAAFKAFLVGLLMGEDAEPAGVTIPVSPAAAEAIGLALIRDGMIGFHLVVSDQADNPSA